MTLAEYLDIMELSDIQFAKDADITRQTVWNLRNGKFAGNAKTLAKIVKATKGEVAYADLIPEAIG